MKVLLYRQKITDKKHNVEFDKDKVSYRGKTFDAVIAKDFRKTIDKAIANGLRYPLALTLDDDNDDYFTKFVTYDRNDGTTGSKVKIVIKNAQQIEQGKFDNKTLDEVCDDLEEQKAKALADNPLEDGEVA